MVALSGLLSVGKLSLLKSMWVCFVVVVIAIFASTLSFVVFVVGSWVVFFSLSISVWFVGSVVVMSVLCSFASSSVTALVLVIMMEVLVVTLRPVTLTLRVYINVMIGHEVMHLLLSAVSLWLVSFVELFVYTVQSFVFCVLSLSYVEEF